ncbi:hypothetical protein AVEN_166046-1 [Araneus ventricosus]|uniref:Uncharacterized protein n=1 Tax=Araneus ventricosus TaxID=182803 RepID=A0A4Y2RML0_ARAVE|nr:hypothetical protein AVEN_166046-1 [Araneus ventricosus]
MIKSTDFHENVSNFHFDIINSICTGSSLQAKDGGRPNITVKFPPSFVKCDSFHTCSTRFLRWSGWLRRVLGSRDGFLRIRRVPAFIAIFERGSEFPLSLKEKLRRSRVLRSLYSDGLKNQRINTQLPHIFFPSLQS